MATFPGALGRPRLHLLPKSFGTLHLSRLWPNVCGLNSCSLDPKPPTYEGLGFSFL
jgi:hypothetical protein